MIKVVLAPTCGKVGVFLLLLKDRDFMYFDFDDEVLASEGSIGTAELMKELHSAYGDIKTILFDEIQTCQPGNCL